MLKFLLCFKVFSKEEQAFVCDVTMFFTLHYFDLLREMFYLYKDFYDCKSAFYCLGTWLV